jgi:hypothetical protein
LGLPSLAVARNLLTRHMDTRARKLEIVVRDRERLRDPSLPILKPLPEMQLLTSDQTDMYCMLMKAKRGGPVGGSTRVVDCNNPYMVDRYVRYKDKVYLVVVDANGLYNFVMMDKLPVGGYEWEVPPMTKEELEQFLEDVRRMSKDADSGLFAEVDIELPWWLHDKLDDYPGLNLVREGAPSPYMRANFEKQAKQGVRAGAAEEPGHDHGRAGALRARG